MMLTKARLCSLGLAVAVALGGCKRHTGDAPSPATSAALAIAIAAADGGVPSSESWRTVTIKEANLRLQVAPGARAEWSVVPGPDGKPSEAVQLSLPSGYVAYIATSGDNTSVARVKEAFVSQADFAKRRPKDATFTQELVVDAADAIVLRTKREDDLHCEVTVCSASVKSKDGRPVCARTITSTTVSPDEHNQMVTTHITESDCLSLVAMVRSMKPAP